MTTAREPKHAINQDAREFGLHMKQGGWRLGLLVARNVVVSPGRVAPETLLPKVNATEFARRAGTSNDRVLRHLAAWERAANAGLVPHSRDLTPGTDIDLDVDRLPAWGPIYNAPMTQRTPTTPTTRTARPTPAPVTTRSVTVAPTPEPDPHDAQEVVREVEESRVESVLRGAGRRSRAHLAAMHDHDAERTAEERLSARDAEWTEDVRYAVNAMQGHMQRLADASREPEWINPIQRERAAVDMRAIATQLNSLADLTEQAPVTDAAINELITNNS